MHVSEAVLKCMCPSVIILEREGECVCVCDDRERVGDSNIMI